jgi:hypothetical protein
MPALLIVFKKGFGELQSVFTPTDDSWSIDTVPINDGKAIYRGKVYKP